MSHKTKKNTTQYMSDTTTRKKTQIKETRHERSYKQVEVKIIVFMAKSQRTSQHISFLFTEQIEPKFVFYDSPCRYLQRNKGLLSIMYPC